MTQPTRLYIFATSVRPDPYINSIMHWMASGSVQQIVLVCIHEHGYGDEDSESQASAVQSSIQELLTSLAGGVYTSSSSPDVPIPADQAARYRECLEKLVYIQVTSLGIRWNQLGDRVREFRHGRRSAFDVTALKKNLLVDIFALLLSEGEEGIFSFELVRPQTYGPDDLMGALSIADFNYRCLTASNHVATAMRRMVARSVTFRVVALTTISIIIPVVLIQLYWPNSWLQSAIVAIGAAVSLASWVFAFQQRT